MTERFFPTVSERILEHRLSNGLTIRVIHKPGFARKYAFFATKYGSIDTSFTLNGVHVHTPNGVAHYLEHKMFDLPGRNVMQEFAARGANPNAFTTYALTAYYFDCTDGFEDNLKLLLEYVSTPYFTPESVEKEQGIIAQEIRMYEDSPSSQVYEQLFAAMYRYHPVRVPIAGTVESIAGIDVGILERCHSAFYHPGNMCLCVVGDVDADSVFTIAGQMLSAAPGPVVERDYGPAEELDCNGLRVCRQMEVAMPMFMLGFKCQPAGSGRELLRRDLLGDLASELLMGEASPLYARLYEQGLIDPSFGVGYESIRGMGLLVASGDSNEPEAVSAAILDECRRLSREGADPALFQRLKRSMLGRRLRDLDSFESICDRQCNYYFDGAEYFEFPELCEALTMEDTLDFLTQTVVEAHSGLSVITPLEEA